MKAAQPATVDATVYLQIEPEWKDGRWYLDANGELVLDGAKVVRLTQTRPAKPKPGVVITKLTLRMPAVAFLPLRPSVVVIVPESMAEGVPLEVTVEDPADDPAATS